MAPVCSRISVFAINAAAPPGTPPRWLDWSYSKLTAAKLVPYTLESGGLTSGSGAKWQKGICRIQTVSPMFKFPVIVQYIM